MANDLDYEVNVSVIRPQAIQRDHSHSVGRCLLAFLHEHLKGGGDPGLKNLLEALRSKSVGRNDVANDLEEKVKTGHLW